MLRFFTNNLQKQWPQVCSGSLILNRNLHDKTRLVIGGGLEKLQGGLKEESYFYNQNCHLMAKIREEGANLKCENCLNDWQEFEKVLSASNDHKGLRETCFNNKHKNCLEEAFFLNEQKECCSKIRKEVQFNKEVVTNNTENFNNENNELDSKT